MRPKCIGSLFQGVYFMTCFLFRVNASNQSVTEERKKKLWCWYITWEFLFRFFLLPNLSWTQTIYSDLPSFIQIVALPTNLSITLAADQIIQAIRISSPSTLTRVSIHIGNSVRFFLSRWINIIIFWLSSTMWRRRIQLCIICWYNKPLKISHSKVKLVH